MALGHRLTRRALCAAAVTLASARSVPRVLVAAHRGHHTAHPENSLAACRSAIRLGCHFVEADARPGPGGALVAAHDAPPPLDAPPLRDLLLAARSRIGVYFDWKDGAARDVAGLLRDTRMLPHALVYAHPQRLLELRALEPAVRLLPEIMDPAQAARLLDTFRPEFAAYSARSLHPEPFALARRAGVKVLVDALGPNDQPDFWQAALDAGAAGLQTDRPAELLAWLRAL